MLETDCKVKTDASDFCEAFEIAEPQGEMLQISAEDFGLSETVEDNTAALMTAMDYCSKHSGVVLNISKGTYNFADNSCDNIISGLKNTVIDGHGALFVFKDAKNIWLGFMGCQCVKVKNLNVDWDWNCGRLADVVQVQKNDTENNNVYLKFLEISSASCNMTIRDYNQMSGASFTELIVGTPQNKTFYHHKIGSTDIEKAADDVLKISYREKADSMCEGEYYLIRHYEYGANAFVLRSCENFTFEDVNVWSVPGMAFSVGMNSHHFQLVRCKVTLKPDCTDRHISATVDCLHIGASRGYWKVKDCVFTHSGDDCINIHDNISEVFERLNKNTLKLRLGSYEVGDTLSFHTAGFADLKFSAVIKDIKFISRDCNNSAFYEVRFDREIDEEILPSCLAFNEKLDGSHYIISGNVFGRNRARGVLLGCGNGIISDNTFLHTQGSAVMIVSDVFQSWCEGRGAAYIWICGNRFVDCNASRWAAILNIAAFNAGKIINAAAFRKILVSYNHFTGINAQVLRIASCRDVKFTNNYFGKINPPDEKLMDIIGNENISISDNYYQEEEVER